MISIRYSEVPSYLHHSKFYCDLDDTDNSPFTVPADCFKKNVCIRSIQDFHLLLRVMQFWMLDSPPQDLIAFALSTDLVELKKTNPDTWELFTSFDFSKNLIELQEQPSNKRMEQAARKNNLEYIKYAEARGDVTGVEVSVAAARNGHLSLLMYLRSQDAPWNASVPAAAARGGYLSCLKYLHEQGCPWSEKAFTCAMFESHHSCAWFCESVHPNPQHAEFTNLVKAVLAYRLIFCYFYPQYKPRYWMYAAVALVTLRKCEALYGELMQENLQYLQRFLSGPHEIKIDVVFCIDCVFIVLFLYLLAVDALNVMEMYGWK